VFAFIQTKQFRRTPGNPVYLSGTRHTSFYQRVIMAIEDSVLLWYLFHWPNADTDKSATDESAPCEMTDLQLWEEGEISLLNFLSFLSSSQRFRCIVHWPVSKSDFVHCVSTYVVIGSRKRTRNVSCEPVSYWAFTLAVEVTII